MDELGSFEKVEVVCDRCKKVIKGERSPWFTSGYYSIERPGYWADFVFPWENIVCDECMFADPRYRKVYPGNCKPDFHEAVGDEPKQ